MNARTLVLLAALAPTGQLAGQSAVAPTGPQIVMSAEGQARTTPDRATILIGVQTRALTAAAAAADNARRQRAVLDTMRALGLRNDQLSTLNYSVYPEMRYDKDLQQTRIVGYAVSNTVRVELKRVDMVGSAIDAALGKGANQINSLVFTSSNMDQARRSALAMAVEQARADAEAVARAAGGTLGPLLEVESGVAQRPIMFQAMRMEGVASGYAPTPVQQGEQTVEVNVTTRWVFQANK